MNDTSLSFEPTPFEPPERPDRILAPGAYLLDLETNASPEAVEDGLYLQGWSKLMPDASKPEENHVRLVGHLPRPIRLIDLASFRWDKILTLGDLDVTADLSYKMRPFELAEGRYALRFIAHMKTHPARDAIVAALGEMRFSVDGLTALKRDMRIPGRPGTSATLWCASARYQGPESHVTVDDPFCFEDVVRVT